MRTHIHLFGLYLANLRPGKIVLWCYLIWYLVSVSFRFDPSPTIWLNSLGISLVIGIGLQLSVAKSNPGQSSFWQTFRLFVMPFCVSSFSSLIKGYGYILIFPTDPKELFLSIGACFVFIAIVLVLRLTLLPRPTHQTNK